jgi:hypothetical protein
MPLRDMGGPGLVTSWTRDQLTINQSLKICEHFCVW